MPYPEPFIAPMRAELTRLGVAELRTPEQVDDAVRREGTVMIVVNSVCGCAAGKARPGIALALQHARRRRRPTTSSDLSWTSMKRRPGRISGIASA